MNPPSEAVTADALNSWILDSVAGSRSRPQYSPTTKIILTYIKKLGQSVKGSKCKSKVIEVLSSKFCATEEDKAVEPRPDKVGRAVAAVQPQIAVVAAHTEQARIARRVDDN